MMLSLADRLCLCQDPSSSSPTSYSAPSLLTTTPPTTTTSPTALTTAHSLLATHEHGGCEVLAGIKLMGRIDLAAPRACQVHVLLRNSCVHVVLTSPSESSLLSRMCEYTCMCVRIHYKISQWNFQVELLLCRAK